MNNDITNFTTEKNLIRLITEAIGLVNHDTALHQQQVGYLAYQLAQELNLSPDDTKLLMQAGLFHDIGGAIQERHKTVEDLEHNQEQVAEDGAKLLEEYPLYRPVAGIICYCQIPYEDAHEDGQKEDSRQQLFAQIIHVADATVLLFDPSKHVMGQVDPVISKIEEKSGTEYNPKVVKALRSLEHKDGVWLNLLYSQQSLMEDLASSSYYSLSKIAEMTEMISALIDFQSPFTAMHSAGVAATARALAKFSGFSEIECLEMQIAGNLHDLGKLRTPASILEKPGKLTQDEYDVIKEHVFFSYLALKRIPGFEKIAQWVGFHHENLDGSGYPFGLTDADLPIGSKIMAIADKFAAITEDRPYRKGLPKDMILSILSDEAEKQSISKNVFSLLTIHFDEINQLRDQASKRAGKHYYDSFH